MRNSQVVHLNVAKGCVAETARQYGAGTQNVTRCRRFAQLYVQPLGAVARRFVSRGIRTRWTDTRAQRIAGIGYATPYLGLFS